MIQIDDKIISRDVFEKHFICQLDQCLGACCVSGDSGAPLEDDEKTILENELSVILPYLTDEGRAVIDSVGVSVIDLDDELVTPLVGNREQCAFSFFTDKGICLCGIEKAYFDGKTTFRKPISCHLYPIRVKQFDQVTGLNYDQWSVCSAARQKGEREGTPVFRFLKEPLIRKFGADFYQAMEDVYTELMNNPQP